MKIHFGGTKKEVRWFLSVILHEAQRDAGVNLSEERFLAVVQRLTNTVEATIEETLEVAKLDKSLEN